MQWAPKFGIIVGTSSSIFIVLPILPPSGENSSQLRTKMARLTSRKLSASEISCHKPPHLVLSPPAIRRASKPDRRRGLVTPMISGWAHGRTYRFRKNRFWQSIGCIASQKSRGSVGHGWRTHRAATGHGLRRGLATSRSLMLRRWTVTSGPKADAEEIVTTCFSPVVIAGADTASAVNSPSARQR